MRRARRIRSDVHDGAAQRFADRGRQRAAVVDVARDAALGDELGAELAHVILHRRVVGLGVSARSEVGVVESSTEHKLMAALRRDVAGHLLEAMQRLVGVLIRQRGCAAEPCDVGQTERVERCALLLLRRRSLFFELRVPRHDAFADDVEERGAVVIGAAVARRAEELAQFHFHAIADLQRAHLGDLLRDRRGIAVFGLSGVASRRRGGHERHAGTGCCRKVVVVDRDRRHAGEERAELRGVERTVRHPTHVDGVAAARDAIGDLDLGDALLPIERQPVVVLAEDDAVDDVFARMAIARAVSEVGDARGRRIDHDVGLEHGADGIERRGLQRRAAAVVFDRELEVVVAPVEPVADEVDVDALHVEREAHQRCVERNAKRRRRRSTCVGQEQHLHEHLGRRDPHCAKRREARHRERRRPRRMLGDRQQSEVADRCARIRDVKARRGADARRLRRGHRSASLRAKRRDQRSGDESATK